MWKMLQFKKCMIFGEINRDGSRSLSVYTMNIKIIRQIEQFEEDMA